MNNVFSHAGNVGDECVDIAASLGAHGFVSDFKTPVRWPERRFGITQLMQVILARASQGAQGFVC